MTVHPKTHGHSANGETSPTYNSWASMVQRCTNSNATSYPRYGGRGISVCLHWLKFENFLSDMGERPEGLTLDRRDNNGNYEPDNCRWATLSEQALNGRPNKRGTKLTPTCVERVRDIYRVGGTTQAQIAEYFEVHFCTINHLLTGRTWQAPTSLT